MSSQEIKVVHKYVKDLLDSLSECKYMKNVVSKGQGQSGNADFTVLYKGVWIDIECKWDMWLDFPTKMSAAKGRLPAAQQSDQLRKTAGAGGVALVVDRHTMYQLDAVFETVGEYIHDQAAAAEIQHIVTLDYPMLDYEQYVTEIKEVNL